MPSVDHPWVLLLLVACVPALLGTGARWRGFASLVAVPRDAVSGSLDGLLRIVAAIGVAAIVLGIAGLHDGPRSIERTGLGAHIVVVLDRSLSMDEPFALKGERATESKSVAASRLLAEFFAQRPHDSFGVVAFSTSPIPAMPLTAHRSAALASIAAMSRHGLANTDIGAGLAMGLKQFEHDPPGAARVILLISDGAGGVDEPVRAYLHNLQQQVGAHFYYLYLRAGDDPPLIEPEDHSEGLEHVFRSLERPGTLVPFLRTLGTYYEGFEARDEGAVAAATKRIGMLENQPITYSEPVPRRDLDGYCYAVAALCLALGLLAQLAEREIQTVRIPR